jgi:glycosyltransferase involved in cell wall biosynthesis
MAEALTDECGYLVEPGDESALADALIKAVSLDPGARSRIRTAAKELVRNRFGIDVIAARLEQLYCRVIDEFRLTSGFPVRL